jgi:hypothetical protein
LNISRGAGPVNTPGAAADRLGVRVFAGGSSLINCQSIGLRCIFILIDFRNQKSMKQEKHFSPP